MKKEIKQMALIDDIKVGDVIVFSDVEFLPAISGERLVVEKSQKENDNYLDDNLPEYIAKAVTYRLTKNRKGLISGTRLTFDEMSTLLLRLKIIDHLDELLNIPADRQ